MRPAFALIATVLLAACVASPTATISPEPEPTASLQATPEASLPAPTIAPTIEPSPTATAPAATATEPPSDPGPTGPPGFGSATLTTTGDPAPNSDLGGCGSLWNGSRVYSWDDCGPQEFNLGAEPVVVAPGGTMTFAAPAGCLFSIDRIASDPGAADLHSWAIAIAPVSALEGLPEGEREAITAEHGGRVLGYGDRAVVSAWVKAPLTPGEYLVQLEASVNLGPWTHTWPRFFWRVSVQ